MSLMNTVLETLFIISLYNLQKFFRYALSLSKSLHTTDSDLVSARKHILDIMVQLKDMQNKLQDKFHDIYELASGKVNHLE
jgi:hypothetical protein